MQTISTPRHFRLKPQQASRCAGSKKEPAPIIPARSFANGFLKSQFLPLYEKGQELNKPAEGQKDFFDSLQILSDVYQLEKVDLESLSYPYNMLLAHASAQMQLNKTGQDIELKILQNKNGRIKLSATHHYNTASTLYYIAVLPLYRCLKNKKQKDACNLLLCVFSYMYHIAGIPYYRDCESYLFYQYECLQEWTLDEYEEGEMEKDYSLISEFNKASYYGDVMLRKIFNPCHLNDFQKRIENFKAVSPFEKECLDVAEKAFFLMEEYPENTIFRNTSNKAQEQDDVISAEQYISFIADTEGELYENIARTINDQFNECGEIAEPTLLQVFDGKREHSSKALDFEYRIFPLLNDLCTLLNKMP